MTYSNELDEGYFVTLNVLDRCLRRISHGAHQYAALPVPGVFRSNLGDPLSLVILAFSNPEEGSITDFPFLNALCYVLPLVALGGAPSIVPELLVAFNSKFMIGLTQGLYIEDDEVKFDFCEDFHRVWTPIHTHLWPPDRASEGPIGDLEYLDEVEAALNECLASSPEAQHREKFIMFVRAMAGDEEMIRKAVEGWL